MQIRRTLYLRGVRSFELYRLDLTLDWFQRGQTTYYPWNEHKGKVHELTNLTRRSSTAQNIFVVTLPFTIAISKHW